MKRNKKVMKIILSALFLALAYVLPFLTGQIPEIGSMLCPLHIPVLLCGFLCGWNWGLLVGIIAPLLRSVTLGMPPLFPTAVCMAFELAAYGAIAGWMHKKLPRKKPYIYCSLLTAMLVGRLVLGRGNVCLHGIYRRQLHPGSLFCRRVCQRNPRNYRTDCADSAACYGFGQSENY